VDSQSDLPKGWSSSPLSADYTITLLVFSWALLPAAFMVMLVLFGRYPEVRLPLAAATLALFAFTFFTGIGQRQSAMRDGRVFLCATMLTASGLVLATVWLVPLEDWWWAAYAAVLGCVPMLFVAMNHLASSTAPAIERPWYATHRLSAEALPGWRVVSGTWTQGEMAWTMEEGTLLVMAGRLDGEQTRLRIEAFAPGTTFPMALVSKVRWKALKVVAAASSEEE